jgi:hypothetical protein
MTTDATAFSRHYRGPCGEYKTFATPNYQQRFSYFIENLDWDEAIRAQEDWVNKMCLGVIIIASIYFIPSVFLMFFDML